MKKFVLPPLFALILCPLSACNRPPLTKYISELRSEIYYGETETFTVTANFCAKEYPYRADGVCGTMQNIVEVTLTATDNTLDYALYFTVDGRTYGGETSFDSIQHAYYFSQSAPTVSEPTLLVTLTYGKTRTELTLQRRRTGKELSFEECLGELCARRKEYFDPLWKNGRFCAEICCRLIFDEQCFWFFGVKDGAGEGYFLLNALTGEIVSEK